WRAVERMNPTVTAATKFDPVQRSTSFQKNRDVCITSKRMTSETPMRTHLARGYPNPQSFIIREDALRVERRSRLRRADRRQPVRFCRRLRILRIRRHTGPQGDLRYRGIGGMVRSTS